MTASSPPVLRAYLAGKVPKGAAIADTPDWRFEFLRKLTQGANWIEALSPEDPELDESDPLSVFGHDCYLISSSNVVIVNADQKLGVGTAQEMLIAKYFRKHVLTLLPRDTHHRRTNLQMHGGLVPDWIHPFISCTSDRVFEDMPTMTQFMQGELRGFLAAPARHIGIIDESILHYLSKHGKAK